jgi:hypothetical protein
MTETEWVEISSGYDRKDVKARARAALAEFGQDTASLGSEQIRVDAGTDTEGRRFFRVRVAQSVVSGS